MGEDVGSRIRRNGGRPKELGERSREELEAYFKNAFAGWERGVNMDGPDSDFKETPMTPLELEARYVAVELGVNIYQLANSAAFAPIIVYQTIQKFLGPLFDRIAREEREQCAKVAEHFSNFARHAGPTPRNDAALIADQIAAALRSTPQDKGEK